MLVQAAYMPRILHTVNHVEQNITCAAARDENAVQEYLIFNSVTRIVLDAVFDVKCLYEKCVLCYQFFLKDGNVKCM